jgi:hypothetical protein
MTGPRPYRLLLLAFTLFGGGACKSDNRRDQFYNTDVGAGWMPDEDAARATAHDAAIDAPTGDVPDARPDVPDAGPDVPDAGPDVPDAGPDVPDAAGVGTADAAGETG